MANINTLKSYINYEFSSGCYTGNDYKTFQTKYINFLKTICKHNNWCLIKVNKNHIAFLPLLKVEWKIDVYIFQLVMLDILTTIGIITYLLEQQKMKSITKVVLITILH